MMSPSNKSQVSLKSHGLTRGSSIHPLKKVSENLEESEINDMSFHKSMQSLRKES